MFDNARERIRKLEETNETFRKAKQHVEKHKIVYIAGTTGFGCLVVGGVAGSMLGREVTVKPTAKNTMMVGYKSPQSILQETIVQVAARADRGHVVIDAATGLPVGGSLTEAALNEGISRASLLKNTRGLTESASNGKQYVDLGENLSEKVTRQVFA